MSDRERWIVYPLLIFALALGFKNKSQTDAKFNMIKCKAIQVETQSGEPRVLITGSTLGGQVDIFGNQRGANSIVQLRGIVLQEGTTVSSVGQINVSNSLTASKATLNGNPNGANLEIASRPYSNSLAPTQPIMIAGFNPYTNQIGLSSVVPASAAEHLGKVSVTDLNDDGIVFSLETKIANSEPGAAKPSEAETEKVEAAEAPDGEAAVKVDEEKKVEADEKSSSAEAEATAVEQENSDAESTNEENQN